MTDLTKSFLLPITTLRLFPSNIQKIACHSNDLRYYFSDLWCESPPHKQETKTNDLPPLRRASVAVVWITKTPFVVAFAHSFLCHQQRFPSLMFSPKLPCIPWYIRLALKTKTILGMDQRYKSVGLVSSPMSFS